MEENKTKNLNQLNDYENMLLTKISYLDIDTKKFEELKKENPDFKISDLKDCLKDPDRMYLGDLNRLGDIGELVNGENKVEKKFHVKQTDAELLEEIEKAGLGDYKVVSTVDRESSFDAIVFEDENKNRGFSFRGTDYKSLDSSLNDWGTNAKSFFTKGDVSQNNEAKQLFEEVANENGKNYLYGHSLGGHLAENVFAENYENIEHVYSVNPFHIDESILKNDEKKLEAFRSSSYECIVIGGDPISLLNKGILKFRNDALYEENIRYIKNNENEKGDIKYAHLMEAAEFDENGNLKETTKEEAYKDFLLQMGEKALEKTPDILLRSAVRAVLPIKLKLFVDNAVDNIKNIYSKAKEGVNKVVPFTKNIRDKVVDGFKDIFMAKDVPQPLEAEEQKEMSTKDLIEKQRNEFEESLRLENWVNDKDFTKEDLAKIKAGIIDKPVISNGIDQRNTTDRDR